MSEGAESSRVLTDEERARAIREQLKSLHAFDLAYEMMVSLVSFGYQKLGLTGETADLRDLDDAHYAIELLGALLNVSDREHPVSDLRDIHSTLAQMQLGYVQALEMEGRRPPEPPESAAASMAPPEVPSEAEAAAAHEETPEEVERDLESNLEAEQASGEAPPRPEEAPPTGAPRKRPPAAQAPRKKPAAKKKPAARKPKPKPDEG